MANPKSQVSGQGSVPFYLSLLPWESTVGMLSRRAHGRSVFFLRCENYWTWGIFSSKSTSSLAAASSLCV